MYLELPDSDCDNLPSCSLNAVELLLESCLTRYFFVSRCSLTTFHCEVASSLINYSLNWQIKTTLCEAAVHSALLVSIHIHAVSKLQPLVYFKLRGVPTVSLCPHEGQKGASRLSLRK